ncbi:MAG: outer membrane protein transport protein [Bacteroidetes bacterium]|nr:outer membrane protein transport protein [Bacteroidota bacterium]
MKKIGLLFLFCLALSLTQKVMAGGFKVALQGQKQVGMAGTGVGFARDGATMYYNPGGLSFVKQQFNLGVSGLFPSTGFLEKGTNTVITSANKMFTPFSFYAHADVSKRIKLGLAMYTPFGTGIAYPADWSGRYILRKIDLKTVFIQPTVALKVSEKLGIGGGFIYSTGSMLLRKDLPITLANDEIASAELQGKARGTGYNVGAYFKANDKMELGITYHSKVKMKLDDGEAVFSNIPIGLSSTFPENNTFTTELNLPAELALGFSYKLHKGFTLAIDFNRTYWNSFDSLGFDYAINTSAVTDAKSPRLYQNSNCFRIGAQINASSKVDLRLGVFFDQTPVPDGYMSPELPDNNKTGVTFGGTFRVDERTHVDVSLIYEQLPDRYQRNKETGLDGTFQTRVIAPGVGLTYLFQKRMTKRKHY